MREHDTTAVGHRADVPSARILEVLRRAGCTAEDLDRLSDLIGSRQRADARADDRSTPPAPHTTLLSAERGIINTGTVHGGQHLTGIEVSGDHVRGADDGI